MKHLAGLMRNYVISRDDRQGQDASQFLDYDTIFCEDTQVLDILP